MGNNTDRQAPDNPQSVVVQVAHAYGLTPSALLARRRDPLVVEARRVTMHLLAERGLGPTAIGRVVRLDHSTVLHHLARLRTRPTWEEREMLTALQVTP